MARYKLVEIDPETNYKSREIIRFNAEDDDGAELYRKAYLIEKDNDANPDLVKWERCLPSTTVNEDGTKTYHEDLFDDLHSKTSLKDKVVDFFECWLIDKPKDAWRAWKNRRFLLKHEYPQWAEWSFDSYLLKTITEILPRLAADSHGVNNCFITAAAKEMFGDSWKEELDKIDGVYFSDDSIAAEKRRKVDELAASLMKSTYKEIVLHAKLYEFYSNFGRTDDIDFDREWAHTIPFAEGSNREFTAEGYKKMNEMAAEHWSKLWDMVKEYGQTFWD